TSLSQSGLAMISDTPLAQGNTPRRASFSFLAPEFPPLPLGQGRGEGAYGSSRPPHPAVSDDHASHRARRGLSDRPRSPAFTLIEILVSLTITLMMMGAVVTLFGVMTDSVSGSRAVIEMSERLRACRNRLQADLQGVTATMQPPLRPENDEGYFEAIEGQYTDIAPGPGLDPLNGYGDTDDILLFTTRTRAEPFVGKFGGVMVESQIAEIAWFMVPDTTKTPPTYTLYRRVRLVNPQLSVAAANVNDDISMHAEGTNYKANSLGDLTKPENRWLHVGTGAGAGFPYRLNTTNIQAMPFTGASGRLGDDVILTNVLAFDVQFYDPGAPIYISNNVSVEPRDAGFSSLIGSPTAPNIPTPTARGAYVDLGYFNLYASSHSGTDLSAFSGLPNAKCGSTARPFSYDTWSLHYENDGLMENGTTDTGTNGLDDNGNGIVDDLGEYDTLPPYSAPLRGIRVIIRVYEPSSQQVREVSVVQDFLPE
ncbi:MAG: prepilin-type N-terminal cleavage/methylation domain-containing protein, partial [Planctomycetia bacterium]|nr:prepilin-type N-terminal cleavage/methylation domain-containing protein [Planctomycetia bacterium]